MSAHVIRSRGASGVVLAALALTALADCSTGGAPSPAPRPAGPVAGGTLVVGSPTDVDSWNEYLARQSFSAKILGLLYLRLAREVDGPHGGRDFEPGLAESWTFSADGRELTFRLRTADWSDGTRVTAEDVRFSWRAQTSPEVAWAGAAAKAAIRDVEVVDPRTVRFWFDRPYPFALADAVDGGILPEHVYGAVPFGEWRTHDWTQAARVTSGPFVLEEHDPAAEIRLARNPRYLAAPLPRLDRVVVRIVPDMGNLVTQTLSGAIDLVEGVPPRDAARVAAAPGVAIRAFDFPNYDYVGWNEERAPLGDAEIRRALTLAIDRRALVDEVLYGYGRVAAGPIPSAAWGFDADLEPWPYDPERARAILSARGFRPRPSDGMLERDGHPFSITLATNVGNEVRAACAVKIQAQLRRVGVAVDVLPPMEMRAFVSRNMAGDFDAYVGGWTFTSGRAELRTLFGSGSIPPDGFDVVRYRSAEVDALLDRADAAADSGTLRDAVRAVARRIHDDQPYTFLFETRRLAAVRDRVRGLRFDVPGDSLARLDEVWLAAVE